MTNEDHADALREDLERLNRTLIGLQQAGLHVSLEVKSTGLVGSPAPRLHVQGEVKKFNIEFVRNV